MDDESKQLLREIRDLQREQIALFRASFPAFAPWLTLRFSLRTLLIATMLVAVVLGLIMAFAK
jgi:hypothetical protein